jgi:hypothetical protein
MTGDVYAIVIAQAETVKRGRLAIWTVYERPTGYPCGYVARMFEAGHGPLRRTGHVIKCLGLEPIQEKLQRAGLSRMARDENDEPQIVESWI